MRVKDLMFRGKACGMRVQGSGFRVQRLGY